MRALLSMFAALSVASCVPQREPLAVYHESSQAAALIAAGLEAKDRGGRVYIVGDTGSMEPTLHAGDYAVGIPTPYEQLEVGMIVNYRPDWNHGGLTIHRLVARWQVGGGWVVEGDGPKNRAETSESMTADKYVDHVVSVYRFP